MAPVDADSYHRTTSRIVRLIAVIAAAGAIGTGVLKGPRFGAGFLIGAALSWLSFWRWKKVVDSLGGDGAKRRSAWVWLFRFALLGGGAYVMVKYLGVPAASVFIGLLASSAAVILAIIMELFDAK